LRFFETQNPLPSGGGFLFAVIPQLLHDARVQVRSRISAVIEWNLPLGFATLQIRTL
jgi:hypothetical protein